MQAMGGEAQMLQAMFAFPGTNAAPGLHHFLWWQLLALLFLQSSGAQVTYLQQLLLCWSCHPPSSWEIKSFLRRLPERCTLHPPCPAACTVQNGDERMDMAWDMDQLLLA